MISFLADSLFPLTLSVALLLLLRPWMLRKIGASRTYLSWLLVPASLVFTLFNVEITSATSLGLEQYAVFSNAVSTGVVNQVELLAIAPIGSFIIIALLVYGHVTSLNHLHREKLTKVHLDSGYNRYSSAINVYQSDQDHSPMLIGLIKPKLILPKQFFSIYDAEQQDMIIQHELCHYQRHDIFWNLLAVSILALFWFHPLVWLAYFKYRQDQELSCDQSVLARKQTPSKINYCKALLAATDKPPTLAFAQLSFEPFGAKNNMSERIQQIKTESKSSKPAATVVLLSSLLLLSSYSVAFHQPEPELKNKQQSIHPLTRVEPRYPKIAVENKLEGSVVLKFDVAPSGQVVNTSVVKSVPNNVFDDAAKSALNKWTYTSSPHGAKDNLIQLDFKLGPDSKLNNLFERVQVQGN